MEIEKKLAEYRKKKEREEKLNEIKQRTKAFFQDCLRLRKTMETEKLIIEEDVNKSSIEYNEEETDKTDLESDESYTEETPEALTYFDYLYYTLWFILWVTLYIIFIKLQFGTVFLIVSALIFMCINTRTGPKKSNEISAYSVFNKDCKSIDGTLKAEQFEREIRYGAGTVR